MRLRDRFLAYAEKRAARMAARPPVVVRALDGTIILCAAGALLMLVMALLLRTPGLGIDLAARLFFAASLALAVRPWLSQSGSRRS